MLGRVLIIAGSDSGGGAGMQADLKTLTALGAYGASAITALTVQDSEAVHEVWPVPPEVLRRQIEVALADPGADAVKIGMLGDVAAVAVVCEVLGQAAHAFPIVLDPVMVASSGRCLLTGAAIALLKERLLARAALLTPNVPEAEALLGVSITDLDGMRAAAAALCAWGVPAVLLKGGHLAGERVVDLLVTRHEVLTFTAPRVATRHTHGTGCTLASAVAAGLAQGMALAPAVARAHAYVQQAIAGAPGFGRGHGPLNHAVTVERRWLAASDPHALVPFPSAEENSPS